jgi:toxin ParE1/3/4
MAEVIWTEPALANIDDIAEYIALHNIKAAKELVQRIFSKVDRLEKFPESGKVPIEIENLNFREVVVPPCRIFYRVKDRNVYILHVMRQERDLKNFILTH